MIGSRPSLSRRSPRSAPSTEPAAGPQVARRPSVGLYEFMRPLHYVVLVMMTTHVVGAWFWGPVLPFGELADVQPLGVPFRYMLWALSLAVILTALNWDIVVGPWSPLLAFFLFGAAAIPFGEAPTNSIHSITQSLVAILIAAALGSSIPYRRLVHFVTYYLLVVLVGSIVYALVLPGNGFDTYFGRPVLRGLFVIKNQCGWIGAVGFVWAVFGRESGTATRIVLAAVSLVVCIWSGSAGALATALCVPVVVHLVDRLRRSRLSAGVALATALTAVIVTAALLGIFLAPIAELLGRDPTLTGRTDIWSAFLDIAMACQPLGCGPGVLSGRSTLTEPVAVAFEHLGVIHTPHNMYIAAFGEGGIGGLLALLFALATFAFTDPLVRRRDRRIALAVPITVLAAIGGLVETRSVYGINVAFFLVVLMRAAWLAEAGRPSAAAAGTQSPAS